MPLARLARITALFYAGLLASIAIYQLGLPGAFLLDDHAHLPLNLEELSLRAMFDATLSSGIGEVGRYLSFFSFALTEATHGADSSGYLRHNILLHALTGCVQFWALGRILSSGRFRLAIDRPWLLAAAVTALWLLHPLLVSTVLYSVQRMTILSALFSWLALLFYVVGRQAILDQRPALAAPALLIGVPAATLLGCISKETTALVPLYLALLEWFAFPGTPADRVRRIGIWATRVVLIVLPLALGALIFLLAHERFLEGYVARNFSLGERLMTEAYAIWWYVRIILLPLVRDLSIYQDGFLIVSPGNLAAWIAGLSLMVLFALSLFLRERLILAGFCVSMFLASHFLESTVLPLEPVFEHRNYFGAVFVILVACHAVTRIHASVHWSTSVSKHLPAALLLISLGILTTQTGIRAWTWSTSDMHTMTSALERPESLRARVELANLHLTNGRIAQARSALREAAVMSPDEPGLRLHLLMITCVSESAETEYEATMDALKGGRITAYTVTVFDRLSQHINNGRCSSVSPAQFQQLIETALELDGIVLRWRYFLNVLAGRTLAQTGDIEAAMRFTKQAVAMANDAPIAHRHRAYVDLAQLSIMRDDRESARRALSKLEELAKDPRTAIDKELREVRALYREPEAVNEAQ